MTAPPSEDALLQMRLAHLNMIQGIVSRLSGFSANAKNFCITILAALVAVAFQKPVPELIWAGFAVPFLFALLDAYYLAQEKRFRDFYEISSAKSLDQATNLALTPPPLTLQAVTRTVFSGSVFVVYLALLAGMSLLLYVAGHQPAEAKPAACTRQLSAPADGANSANRGNDRTLGQPLASASAQPGLLPSRQADATPHVAAESSTKSTHNELARRAGSAPSPTK